MVVCLCVRQAGDQFRVCLLGWMDRQILRRNFHNWLWLLNISRSPVHTSQHTLILFASPWAKNCSACLPDWVKLSGKNSKPRILDFSSLVLFLGQSCVFSVRGRRVRLRSGGTHRTKNPKHPVRQRGFVQAGEQHRGGGEQDAQQEQLVLGCTARAEPPAGRGRSVSHCLL